MRLNDYYRLDLAFSFYRTERGNEVDCIIETPSGETIALEIKSTVDPVSSMLKGLNSFKEKVPHARLILGCRVERAQLVKDVTILPWQEVLELIKTLS